MVCVDARAGLRYQLGELASDWRALRAERPGLMRLFAFCVVTGCAMFVGAAVTLVVVAVS